MPFLMPPVVLFDLDDTIVSFDQHGIPAWREVCDALAASCGRDGTVIFNEIQRVADAYWSDPERHRLGRLKLDETRRDLVRTAFRSLALDEALADQTTEVYIALREKRIDLFPGARETLSALSRRRRLALVTNGESRKQRAKIERFDLQPFFERIFVEEEVGLGKPDPRVYTHILREMDISAADCCMVGDNLEWDVAAPQSLGIFAVWNDWRRQGLPSESTVKPDRIVHGIAELAEE